MLIHNKDDIEFVTEFPCLLGHPVQYKVKQLEFVESVQFIYSLLFLYFQKTLWTTQYTVHSIHSTQYIVYTVHIYFVNKDGGSLAFLPWNLFIAVSR